jgi:phage-related protein
MPAVGSGVIEIRVHTENEYRVFDLARRTEVVHVLHAFKKKTRKTHEADIAVAKRRLRRLTDMESSR